MADLGDTVESILVIRLSSIGDIILTTPVLSALCRRFPGSSIDFVVKAEYEEIIRNHPAIRQVWSFDKTTGFKGLQELKEKLRQQDYGLIVDLHCNLRSTYLRLRTPAFIKRTYRKRTLARLMLKKFRVNLLRNAPLVCDRYFTALEDFAISREDRKPELYLPPQTCSSIEELMAREGVNSGYVCLAPGAAYPTKQWYADGFVEAGASLAKEETAVVITGGEADVGVGSAIQKQLEEKGVKALNMAGRLSIAESAAVIKNACVVISNDSGLMHVADALDRSVVAVFGPTTRELGFYPLGEKARVVEVHGLSCRPCTLHGDLECPEGHHNCMRLIGADEVVEEAYRLMEKDRA